MKTVLALLALMLISSISQAKNQSYSLPRTQVVPITNSETGGQYELYIKLPEHYEESTDKRYPVIYTTDAHWHLDLLSGNTAFLMEDVILVGISWQKNMDPNIDYGHRRPFASRFRDYSFLPHSKPEIQSKYQFGQADKHLAFIRNDVIKHIEKHYRVDPKQRSYLGYSMGGEFGAYVLFSQPDTFAYYMLGSPALNEASIAYLEKLKSKHAANAHVFVSIGELETANMQVTQQFMSMLKGKTDVGFSTGGLEVIQDADHTTAVPETFTRSIKWLSNFNKKKEKQ